MSRPAVHLMSVPAPGTQTARNMDAGQLLTVQQLADRLQVSRTTIERHVHDGMPAIDVARHHPGRRPKRLLRFDLARVYGWLEKRP